MAYSAPVEDLIFVLKHMTGFERLNGLEAFSNYDSDLLEPILEEAGKLARDVLAPLNQIGDREGARLEADGVVPAPGFGDAYKAFQEGGWMSLAAPEEWGGQGLPKALALAVMETVHSANMAFGLCPMLSEGAIAAIHTHGTDAQKQMYLPKLVSGEWTGTMNLTEPQAGSDVGALKSKAVPNGDGSYAVSGQKIFITWGDHDVTDNIVHLVLARLPDAPAGSRGVSLFLVPKFLVNEDGTLGARNGAKCIGLEEKLGIHASPTCVMEYDGATGWLIGAPNKGLACMFTMMNSARLNVGLQGVSVGEAAYQTALEYARERKQGKAGGVEGAAPIIHHPDIRRTLMTMKARIMASRAICFACGVAADLAEHGDEADREHAKLREELLTPIAKAWATDMGVEVSSLGVQVRGGMGFMNETLAAQLYKDSRIAPIYEGTNGIQAIDLVGRKLTLGDGLAMRTMLEDVSETARLARESNEPDFVAMADHLDAAAAALEEATGWMIETMKSDRDTALGGATAYLALAGDVIGGHFLTRGALAARGDDANGHMIGLACFFAETDLAEAPARVPGIIGGGERVAQFADAVLGAP